LNFPQLDMFVHKI